MLETASKKVFNVGQIVKFDWKVAMAVESSQCKNIEMPYISAVVHVSDSAGKISAHAFDMSFSEFNVRLFLNLFFLLFVPLVFRLKRWHLLLAFVFRTLQNK